MEHSASLVRGQRLGAILRGMWFRAALFAGLLALAGTSYAGVVVLENDASAFVDRFNARAEKLRFVAILSPT